MAGEKRVCVIGAGPSGITAAKNLLDQSLDVVIYDYGKEVGGNWVFSDTPSHSSVFETTHIISSKTLSQYDDFPMPADYPDYPSHQQLATYFQNLPGISSCMTISSLKPSLKNVNGTRKGSGR